MLPCFYSEIGARSGMGGWKRVGYDVVYYKSGELSPWTGDPNPNSNSNPNPSPWTGKYYYALSFKMKFDRLDDICYLAYGIPYTYTDLNRDLETLEKEGSRAKYIRKETLCASVGGQYVQLLTITATDSELATQKVEKNEHGRATACEKALGENSDKTHERQMVFISARVHPGEANASWMMKGVLLTLNS